LENRRTSGENKVLLENLGANVLSQNWMYGPKCHSRHTAPSPNVLPVCDKEPYFHQPSYSSYFLVIELCFNRNRIDDRSFLSIRDYGASRELHGGALRSG
jgi:hypothetical protein